MIDTRIWRIGVLPLFSIALLLTRHEDGAHLGIHFHIYKLGFHMNLSILD